MDKTCGQCERWIDWVQFYDDPLEDDDYGYCQKIDVPNDGVTRIDGTCEFFELHSHLAGEKQ